MPLDEGDGALGVPGGEPALVLGRDLGVDDRFPLDQGERRVGAGLRLGVVRPHVVRVGEAEVLIEAVMHREEARMMAEVPLARHPGRVALLLQHLGERGLPVRDAVPGLRAERPVDADAVGIAAGQERRPRGRADRLGDVEVGEPPPLAREPVEVRRGEPGGTIAADVGISQVVGEDDDDVRRPRCRVERGRREQRGDHADGREPDGVHFPTEADSGVGQESPIDDTAAIVAIRAPATPGTHGPVVPATVP